MLDKLINIVNHSQSLIIMLIQLIWLASVLLQLPEQGEIEAIYYCGDIELLVLMAILLVINKDKLWEKPVAQM
nr:hypothetical protein BCU55_13760 [Shewanella sp. 10N.286.48.A6]